MEFKGDFGIPGENKQTNKISVYPQTNSKLQENSQINDKIISILESFRPRLEIEFHVKKFTIQPWNLVTFTILFPTISNLNNTTNSFFLGYF
jgi:hypothetical protein